MGLFGEEVVREKSYEDGDPNGGSYVLTGMEGWCPSPGWSAGSVHDGRTENPVRKGLTKMTGSLVLPKEVTFCG